eukprot:2327740-Pyramimonas_sp.AAC.1
MGNDAGRGGLCLRSGRGTRGACSRDWDERWWFSSLVLDFFHRGVPRRGTWRGSVAMITVASDISDLPTARKLSRLSLGGELISNARAAPQS